MVRVAVELSDRGERVQQWIVREVEGHKGAGEGKGRGTAGRGRVQRVRGERGGQETATTRRSQKEKLTHIRAGMWAEVAGTGAETGTTAPGHNRPRTGTEVYRDRATDKDKLSF